MLAASAQLPRPLALRFVSAVARAPFTGDTWRRTAYAFLALPVGVACVPLALVGGPAGRLSRRMARALLGLEVGEPARTGIRALFHAVLTIPLNFLVAVITGYGWSIVLLNLAYPARPLVGLGVGGANAWGGPTFAGVWAFHAVVGGLGFLLMMPWIVRALTWSQGRLVGALLG
ncbi:hypothetical protein GCM10023322_01510 [Rugosimonospora acidiphila]|uniref:Sensor domain-containing protein n=1 Tax=Rugosimonospora acidiphila TaxID=556531 RepID=A0ABP9RHF4_9ACTN